jgi:hypothetical protein
VSLNVNPKRVSHPAAAAVHGLADEYLASLPALDAAKAAEIYEAGERMPVAE